MLFSLFILYDTQKIIESGEKYRLAKESHAHDGDNLMVEPDYIKGSLGLYLDIVNIFIRMLDLTDIKHIKINRIVRK